MSRSSVLADMGSLRFPAGSLVSQSQFYMTGSTASAVTSTTKTNFWSQAFTPSGNGGKNNTIISSRSVSVIKSHKIVISS